MKTEQYWEQRYARGGNSGDGSYGDLALFKAQVINDYIKKLNIVSMNDWGFGDCNQLQYFPDIDYVGYEVSQTAIKNAQKRYPNKIFRQIKEHSNQKKELSISLDVLYHLIENELYYEYLNNLFNSATRLVIIYSSNYQEQPKGHQYRRNFTPDIEKLHPEWQLTETILNKYPYKLTTGKGSHCNFYIYQPK